MKENLRKLEEFVKRSLSKEKTGHGYEHAKNVLKIALKIAKSFKQIDYDALFAACLLHDISYKKGYMKEHHIKSAEQSKPILEKFNFSEEKIKKIQEIIAHHVFCTKPSIFVEGRMLRDADYIDGLGSIGLIRMISFSLTQKIPYFKSKRDMFNETFYGNIKSLLKWPEKISTKEGKIIAGKRIKIIKQFLKQIEKEYK